MERSDHQGKDEESDGENEREDAQTEEIGSWRCRFDVGGLGAIVVWIRGVESGRRASRLPMVLDLARCESLSIRYK